MRTDPRSRNLPRPFAASDLAAISGRALLTRQPFAADRLDEVIVGGASPSVDEVNIGRSLPCVSAAAQDAGRFGEIVALIDGDQGGAVLVEAA